MSIFGKMDAATIPSNPYFIEKGTYAAEVTKAYFKTNQKGSKQLVVQYVIDEESSEYNKNPVTKYYFLPDPEMTAEAFQLLPKDEKAKIQRNMSTLKKDLCGNSANASHKGLGVAVEDLNDDNWDPQILVGLKVNIGVKNYGTDNESIDVGWVNLREE